MSYKYRHGDVIIPLDGENNIHVVITLEEKRLILTWVRYDGTPAAILWKKSNLPSKEWAQSVMRGDTVVWVATDFEFGDKVKNVISPETKAVFLEYNDDGKTAKIAYKSSSGEVTIETSSLIDLRSA